LSRTPVLRGDFLLHPKAHSGFGDAIRIRVD
jgi:hypothetical protein